MCDGYAAYNLIDTVPMTQEQRRIQRVACWVHVRRYFQKCADLGDKNATDIVALINKLFSSERTIRKENEKKNRRGADAHAYTLSERQIHVKPIIDQIKTRINACQPYYTPARDMSKAINCTLTLPVPRTGYAMLFTLADPKSAIGRLTDTRK